MSYFGLTYLMETPVYVRFFLEVSVNEIELLKQEIKERFQLALLPKVKEYH